MALGTAQDAGRGRAAEGVFQVDQGEAMTAQEKQLVDDLWNTDPAKARNTGPPGSFWIRKCQIRKYLLGNPLMKEPDYIAPNGKILAREYKNWIGTNMRDEIIKKIEDKDLYNIFNPIYIAPGSIIGDGGTADVIRFEKETGLLLSKSAIGKRELIC